MFTSQDIYNSSDWKIWLVVVLVTLLFLWIFFGGDKQEFIGLKPIFDESDDESSDDGYEDYSSENIEEISDLDTDVSYTQGNHNKTKYPDNFEENVTYINYLMSSREPDHKISNTDKIDPTSYISSRIKRRDHSNNKKFLKPKFVDFENHFLNNNTKPPIPQFPHYVSSKNNTISFDDHNTHPDSKHITVKDITPNPPLNDIKLDKFVEPSKGEAITRKAMQDIYGVPFISARPDFLKNPETHENLELDCYNADLAIAAEYNGIQHYLWPNYTNQTEQQFHNQLRRDEFKINQCDLNGVYLITVPYEVPYDMIPKYIEYYLPENVAARQESSGPNMVIHSIY